MMRSYRGPLFADVFSSEFSVWLETSPYHYARTRQGLPPMLLAYAANDNLRRQAAIDLAKASGRGGGEGFFLPAPTKDHYSIDGDLADLTDPFSQQVMQFIRKVAGY